jgi:hypothetical protein
MLIIDLLKAGGCFLLLICSLLCVLAISQNRGRRKVRAHRLTLLSRVIDF